MKHDCAFMYCSIYDFYWLPNILCRFQTVQQNLCNWLTFRRQVIPYWHPNRNARFPSGISPTPVHSGLSLSSESITPVLQLYLYLSFQSMQYTSIRFGLSQSTVWEVVTELSLHVLSSLRPTVSLTHHDDQPSQIPGCIGYVDSELEQTTTLGQNTYRPPISHPCILVLHRHTHLPAETASFWAWPLLW